MLDDALYDAFGQRQVSTMFTQLNQYRVVLETQPASSRGRSDSEEHLPALTRRTPVPLGAFTEIATGSDAARVNHQGQFPVVTVSFNLAPDASLGAGGARDREGAEELGMPRSIQASFQGTAAAFRASLANERLLILAAIVTVYIVLGVLYESYIHPITILSTLPSAGSARCCR
jgi:multidrug efflux pump